MDTKLLELKPDRSLLNSNFDGYKLSLDRISTTKLQFETPVNLVIPDYKEYSFLHGQLFSYHNHLTGLSTNGRDIVYFIDKTNHIKKCTYNSDTNHLYCETVWKIPANENKKIYNATLKLTPENKAVISDGAGYLYLVDTTDDEKWKLLFSDEVIGNDNGFIIFDVASKSNQKEEFHILLANINKNEQDKYYMLLHWIVLTKAEDNTWGEVSMRQLTTKGFIQYAYFERNCNYIYVVSEGGCKFILDSENEVKEANEDKPRHPYVWSQTDDSLSIKLYHSEASLEHIKVTNDTSTQITIKYKDEILISGNLHKEIEPDLTTWNLENSKLEVLLMKKAANNQWSELIEGDEMGQYEANLPDEDILKHLTSSTEACAPMGATFNSQQVEECDFESDKFSYFERLSCENHRSTHKVNLGSHQIFFSINLQTDQPPAFGIRHDVDTLIYQPEIASDKFAVTHKGTLLAMGYIQASKQSKKFFTCPPNMSYSVICESNSHVLVYRQNKSVTSGQLRNRLTGERIGTIAQQQVINIGSDGDVLGIYAANSVIFLLGETYILTLQL